MKSISGGEVMAQMLREEGVEKVFGIIDGTYFGFYSALADYGIELVTPRHETMAVHMAGAYARMTGKLGVCMASNGPGVANALSGIAVENGEGNRILFLTSSRRTGIGYPDRGGSYQYFNQVAVIKPMAKWSGSASSFARISELLRRALRISYRGRPGVVHLDVPENLINGKQKWGGVWKPNQYRRVEPIFPSPEQVKKAAKMLAQAELPMIHAGSGVFHAEAHEELETLAEMLHAPVTTSWSARGAIPETNPLAWSMIHVKPVNEVRNAADLVLCLGSRLGETDWWGKAPYWRLPAEQKMIQVDIDEDILGCNKPATLPLLADAKIFLQQLIEQLKQDKPQMPLEARKEAVSRLAKSRDKDRAKLDEKLDDKGVPMTTAHVAHLCCDIFDDDAVVVFDGGNTAVWGNFYHQVRVVNTQLSTHHFGMLGAGVAQALGAAVARPNKQVYCIIGDGAFGFQPQEVETAVRNNLKVIYLVCCDKQWGMVKINQQFALKPIKTMLKKRLDDDEVINANLSEIEFDKLAQSMGAHGERAQTPDELRAAIKRSLEAQKCAVIHIDVDPAKHMWAPGLLHFKDMHQEPAGK